MPMSIPRKRVFIVGACFVVLNGALWSIAARSERTWMYAPGWHEGAWWCYGGFLISLLAIALLLFGTGWRRLLLEIIAVAELYLWFSWIAFAVMVH
jgi:hypothetical protein